MMAEWVTTKSGSLRSKIEIEMEIEHLTNIRICKVCLFVQFEFEFEN